MQVEDNGPGLGPNPSPNGNMGIGLANARARLQQSYGDNYGLEIANSATRGVIVTLDIPTIQASAK